MDEYDDGYSDGLDHGFEDGMGCLREKIAEIIQKHYPHPATYSEEFQAFLRELRRA